MPEYKNVKIKINESELNALEDILMCWNLCKKHNSKINAKKKDYAIWQSTCPDCIKERMKLRKKAWDVTCRLWDEYEKKQKH
jgi:hypothetical protein